MQNMSSTRPALLFDHLVFISFCQEGELNPALRFANVTFWWSFVCGVQWLFAWGISERYILENPALRCGWRITKESVVQEVTVKFSRGIQK